MEIPEAPEGVSTLIEHCWEQDPANRWSMTDVSFVPFEFMTKFIGAISLRPCSN